MEKLDNFYRYIKYIMIFLVIIMGITMKFIKPHHASLLYNLFIPVCIVFIIMALIVLYYKFKSSDNDGKGYIIVSVLRTFIIMAVIFTFLDYKIGSGSLDLAKNMFIASFVAVTQ
ncbi:hypothetical protein [Clostridium sp.]|uniref:hypothetical protein n=1 Tax=Clostridium sp. TaxID=1506 RepID=UPI002FC60453